jgi:endogenous inhibitor of DNA gyrase (YacG/DUF329 family)
MYRICPTCGGGFNAKTNNEKYCCQSCKTQAMHAREGRAAVHEQRTCEYCGKEFVSGRRDQRFCSARCRVANNRRLKKHDKGD